MGLSCSSENISSIVGICKSDTCKSLCAKDNANTNLKAQEQEIMNKVAGIVHDQILALEKRMEEKLKPMASPSVTRNNVPQTIVALAQMLSPKSTQQSPLTSFADDLLRMSRMLSPTSSHQSPEINIIKSPTSNKVPVMTLPTTKRKRVAKSQLKSP